MANFGMKTMNNSSYMWIAIAVMFVAFMWFASKEDIARNDSYNKCVIAMQQAIPDPNDDSRASFLENCQK